ncbi:hypothetical protein KIN20_016099 [Parelaphostrongylus tenuis]|uniref:Uncharacterized protein n=1 Tax=Parelaphostrongylus tenuis TaxID=148309 RepID=A0AAD5N0Z9_PARTN|nr:hypothetical protein KIN20_016099 [Parelaphostrongylus tenuis]
MEIVKTQVQTTNSGFANYAAYILCVMSKVLKETEHTNRYIRLATVNKDRINVARSCDSKPSAQLELKIELPTCPASHSLVKTHNLTRPEDFTSTDSSNSM